MVNGVMWAALADFVSIVKYPWISARQVGWMLTCVSDWQLQCNPVTAL